MSKLLIIAAACLQASDAYTNVMGTELEPCSGPGMARTGFMRDG